VPRELKWERVGMALDGLDEAGQDGDGDGDVAGGDENGDDFREGAENRGVGRVADAKGLEHAPETVIEVIAEHDHGDDVEERNGPNLKTGDDVVVDVVFDKRTAGMDGSESEVEEMENDEGENDGAAPDHGAGSIGGVSVDLFRVWDRTGGALETPELRGGPNVQGDGKEQDNASGPEQRPEIAERLGIVIDFFRREIDLQVAEEMADDKAEENEAGDGHDGLFADGGLPEPQAAGGEINRSGAHGVPILFEFPIADREQESCPTGCESSGRLVVEDMPSPPRESQ